MTKKEYLKVLNNTFSDFKFYAEDHHYEFKGQRINKSVTALISDYSNEFNAEEIAEKVAILDNKTIKEVLDEWNYKNQFACNKGTNGHNFAQSLWSGELYQPIEFDNTEAFKIANNAIYKQAEKFYNDYQARLEHLADEFVVGSEEYDIASAIDHLFINKLTGELILVDYKTNSDIHKSEKYAKYMKIPLNNLKDYTLNHYYIQLLQ